MAKPNKHPRLRRTLKILGAVVVVGLLPLAGSAGHVALAASGRVYSIDDVPEQPVGLVLGAKADPGHPSGFLAARLDLAVQLFNASKIRAVLVSGDGREQSNFETKVMSDYLVERGIPADKIVADPAGYDTYDSCVRARDVFGVSELTIITQDYHLNRALTICRGIGVDAIGVPDTTARSNFPSQWQYGVSREWLANLKMEWDLLTRREPQQDPPDDSLLKAAEA